MGRSKLDNQISREVNELARLLRREAPGVDAPDLARRLHAAGVRVFPVLTLSRVPA